MYLKRYFVEGLAHASYLFGADGQAAVVDPKRDVEDYLEDAARAGLKITAVLNTHPHADFVSGFPELSAHTGAKVYTSHHSPVTYEHVAARDGDRIRIGSIEVEMLETPGHSPDSLSFLVREGGQPSLVFTGDLLFVNDVGRPDLRDADSDPTDLAEELYDSLFNKILSLPDDVKVYPAHGAGSLCGRALGSEPFTTVGQQRLFNWAAQIKDRGEFVRQMTTNLPDRPAYFAYDVGVNLRGAAPFSQLTPLSPLTQLEVKQAVASGAAILDTRSSPLFGAGHFPGSVNIGLDSAMFSTWVGFFVPGDSQIVLVVGEAASASEARLGLARIGFDHVLGYIEAETLTEVRQLSQLSGSDVKSSMMRGEGLFVLDVRTAGEWRHGHIETAKHLPLPALPKRIADVPHGRPLAIICASGYRSSIAASLLLREGYTGLLNVMGGMEAYQEFQCPDWLASDLVFAGEYI